MSSNPSAATGSAGKEDAPAAAPAVDVPVETPARSDPWTMWMQAAAGGDRQAFDRLQEAAQPAIRRHAQARLQDAVLADLVAARTFMRAWKHRASYDAAKANVSTWLFCIADGLITDEGRARRRRQKREVAGYDSLAAGGGHHGDGGVGGGEATVRVEPEDDIDQPPPADADLPSFVRLVREGLDRLSETDQQVLRLCYYEGLSYEQIAERMKIGVQAVGPRLTRARQRLLERLAPEVLR